MPSTTRLALDHADRALAGRRIEVRDVDQARGLAPSRRATMAAASGCSLARSTLAASRSISVSSKSGRRHDRDDLRLAFGQRAGLVDHQRVDLLHALQRFGVLDENAGLRAAPDADHDRHRRGKAERAGAGDDQNADGGDQPEGDARLRPEHRPGGKCDERHRDDGRHEPAGDLIGQSLDRRARALRIRNHLTICDSIVSRPTLSARITKPPDWLSVPAITLAPASLVTGIDSPVTSDSSSDERPSRITPSTGTFSPGRTRSLSPTARLSICDLLVGAVVVDAPRGLRREVEQRLDRAGGRLAGAQLQHLAEQHQHRDDGGGFEIDRDRAAMAAEGRREDLRARRSRPRCRA